MSNLAIRTTEIKYYNAITMMILSLVPEAPDIFKVTALYEGSPSVLNLINVKWIDLVHFVRFLCIFVILLFHYNYRKLWTLNVFMAHF